jgi:hypothetical protein
VSEINDALTQFNSDRSKLYRLYQAYYDGDHRLSFASEKFRNTFGRLFTALADNLCPRVVDALADRLQLVGFEVERGPAELADEAMDLWQENRMDQRAGQTILEALISGDSYVLVWPATLPDIEGERPVFYPQDALEMVVHYDQEIPGQINWAAKFWRDDERKKYRMTLYYPDRIEKWETLQESSTAPTKDSAFVRRTTEGEPWPIRNEYGRVPVFHFANNARKLGKPGQSELKDIIPLQDALNKAIADMLVAMEFSAFRQRWVTGIDEIRDPVTQRVISPWEPGSDRVWTGPEGATFGEFGQTDLNQFLQVQESFRAEIARVSATPLHYMMLMSGNFPSGESMKTAEAPFTAKGNDRMITFGNTWEDAVTFALKIMGRRDFRLNSIWKESVPQTMQQPGAAPAVPALPGVPAAPQDAQEVSMPLVVGQNGRPTNGR